METINKRKLKIFRSFGLLVMVVFMVFVFVYTMKNTSLENIKYVVLGDQKIKVDLALTDSEKEQGLSGRKNLPSGTGMLFVFAKAGSYPFWMKDMNFPIDIIWINKDLKIVYIKPNASQESYPQEVFDPQASAKYVLEVPAGFTQTKNVKIGDRVKLIY